MPTPHYRRVQQFMQKVGQPTPALPEIPDEATRILRATLILEEALETVTALGVEVTATNGTDSIVVNDPEVEHVFRATSEVDLEGVVDGCADISVVTVGTLIAFGVDDESVLEEVDAANLRKFEPGSYMREDGKWMKPPGWSPPDIEGVLRKQVRIEI
jgi:predicted HAD superfamily Cof-like phosphohydrolase